MLTAPRRRVSAANARAGMHDGRDTPDRQRHPPARRSGSMTLTELMETMPISKFKATCLAVLRRVRATGQRVRITRRGEPIADIVPPGPPERLEGWLGAMSDRARITCDITVPSSDLVPWEVEEE